MRVIERKKGISKLFGYKQLGEAYTIPQLDLSVKPKGLDSKYDELFNLVVVDDESDYMAHPDAVLLKDGSTMTFYPAGHGKGKILSRRTVDEGKTWSARIAGLPKSWDTSRETPTVYRLQFNDGCERIILISGNPTWGIPGAGDGFNVSISNDDGKSWTEFKKFFGKNSEFFVAPVVSFASLTRLKDDKGNWRDAWMGFFHISPKFVNYKTILTFDIDGTPQFTIPEPYFAEYRDIEHSVAMCEVEVIRSDKGMGDRLCLIARSNGRNRNKKNNSIVSYSDDEGKTWSAPQYAPAALNGERHKADYLKDGRLFITFRSIERDSTRFSLSEKLSGVGVGKWFSEGWIAWVGTFEDIIEGREGQYRIKVAHGYLPNQTKPSLAANDDTGYCGNVVYSNGKVMTINYGTFGKKSSVDQNKFKTYICSKTIDMKLADELVNKMKKKLHINE